jgi:hypothetical protein
VDSVGERRIGRGYRVSFTIGRQRSHLPLILPVNGSERFHSEALQDPAFAPGRRLSLRPQPDNPYNHNAVMVWDEGGRLHVGYVPAEYSALLADQMNQAVLVQARVVWEWLNLAEKRTHIRMLVHQGSP